MKNMSNAIADGSGQHLTMLISARSTVPMTITGTHVSVRPWVVPGSSKARAYMLRAVLRNSQRVVEASGNLIDGGAGNDYISAGTGADIVHGGDDDIEGLDGADGLHNNNGTRVAGLMLRTPTTDRAWQTGCRMLHSRGA